MPLDFTQPDVDTRLATCRLIDFWGGEMKRIAAVVIVGGIAFAQAGCASAQTGGAAPPSNCDGTGVCKVEVSVVQCFITPDPGTLPGRGRNVVIFWNMNSADDRFNDPDGIKLKQEDSDFDQAGTQDNGRRFRVHDKNSKARPGEKLTYPYNIRVQRQMGGRWYDCPPLDPVIINEG